MGYTLDYFVAALRCPYCGKVSKVDNTTNMATYIRSEPELAYLGEGHPLIIEPDKMRERGYIAVQEMQKDKPIVILHSWECPYCGTGPHWAKIVVSAGKIESISSVDLNCKTLDHANFIQDEAKGVVSALTDLDYIEISDEKVIPILRKYCKN